MQIVQHTQAVTLQDLGLIDYQSAWDYQERLLRDNVSIKSAGARIFPAAAATKHYLLLCEHPPVYTLGKNGHLENLLINEQVLQEKGIQFYKINRGGDITFHGPQQLVGYPILDLEKFYTDIGRYLRSLEEVIIRTIAEYGIQGERLPGETGVWIEPCLPHRARKICAIGVRCSRWVTMHGFALNVNTDLHYFNYIIPCGIPDKQVTSLEKELGHPVPMAAVKEKLQHHFAEIFGVHFVLHQGLGL